MTRSEDYKPRAVTDHRDMKAMNMMDDIGILKTPSLLTPQENLSSNNHLNPYLLYYVRLPYRFHLRPDRCPSAPSEFTVRPLARSRIRRSQRLLVLQRRHFALESNCARRFCQGEEEGRLGG